MPRGSNFLLRRQKKVTKGKATPTFAPCVRIARFKVKTSRGSKLATLKQQTASSTFSLQISDQGECRGRLFFGDFLLAKQKKVTAARHERNRGKQRSSFHGPLTLALSRKGRGD